MIYYNWTGCSRWTNASRSMAVHINTDHKGEPLCAKHYSNGTLSRTPLNLQEVTCKKCLRKYKQQTLQAA